MTNPTETPNTVYSIYLMTGIKTHRVVGSDSNYIQVRHGGETRKAKENNAVYVYDRPGWPKETYYPTRETAVDAAIARCQERIAQAEKEIKSNRNAIKKLRGMKAAT